ncbi:chemotaxis protein CheX [Bdellovibrio reynosensis]|uniref:Chemotaxis protein CheX n=1 Tax=Bdellovibrio reynosensis TaxID=2835041 RepID=A0ABY4CFY7_9BACT|nr:chemotaxis protein CheX [Bdellovibrio reynosensis]UOF01120.1 chemotaxis protein CheX [Bdellovibrio reynosensis]
MTTTIKATTPKVRKNILLVDNKTELEKSLREPLFDHLEASGFTPIMVRAKDGAEAAMKSENQKFDMVLIDTDVPRLMDGGFVYGINTFRNTQDANLIVMSNKDIDEIPEQLRRSRFFKKPVNAEELMSTMVTLINTQHHGGKPIPPPPPKFAVDVRVINALLASTTKVMAELGMTSMKMEKAGPRSPQEPILGEVSSIIDIKSASFQGYLCVSFDKACYLDLISKMFGEVQEDFTPDNQDAVGEINNIILGNAKADLEAYGVEMTVPRVIMGANQLILSPQGAAGMMIPFATEKGRFYLQVVGYPVPKKGLNS